MVVLVGVLCSLTSARGDTRPWEAGIIAGVDLPCLLDQPADNIALFGCGERCGPIPWQLDERGPEGDLVFEGGDLASVDDPPRKLDANDEVVFMTADGGRSARREELPPATCAVAVRLRRAGSDDRWIYALAFSGEAPRSATNYVRYDFETDTLWGQGIALGFQDRIPQQLLLLNEGGAGVNLLDRLKVRATAWFLGLIPVTRNEGDLEAALVGWHTGPVRIVRRQRQRIRVGWGIKSPRFSIDTYFYRSSAAIPVAFHLNFPPTYFFSNIRVESILDFRDLRGWRIRTPAQPDAADVTGLSPERLRVLNESPAEWFTLIGPQFQLVQFLEVSASLDPLAKRLLFRTTADPHSPEAVPGEMPGIGYALTGWVAVDRGNHAFAAVTFLLPADQDVAAFARERVIPTQIDVIPAERGEGFQGRH